MSSEILTMENLNPAIKNIGFPNKVFLQEVELNKQLANGVPKPFKKLIRAHAGDIQALGQKPLTYLRQLCALVTYPELLTSDHFPSDIKSRAREILEACKGGTIGAYSYMTGLEIVRKHVAEYIMKRDGGIHADYDNIVLTSGATGGIKMMLEMLSHKPGDKPVGFMIPIPQYPVFDAVILELGSQKITYYMDEENNWDLNINELERAYQDSLGRCEPRAIVVINPGNPTGQVLTLDNIKQIIKWSYEKRLYILADEVYQQNIYADGKEFHSFKKVAHEMGEPYSNMEIASFFTSSKGFTGECGARAGYFEVINMNVNVKAELRKLALVDCCTSVIGQVVTDAAVKPPQVGDPSYELFTKEKDEILASFREKAKLVTSYLNKIKGIKCNKVEGAMYAFAKIDIPQKAIDYAKSQCLEPDAYYCMEVMEQTGVVLFPGSVFFQKPGTYHFRTTILPPIDEIKTMLSSLETFHLNFIKIWT